MPIRRWPWHYFVVIQHCPVYADIAPYIQCCLNPVAGTPALQVNSIFRGEAAATILHRYGKETQADAWRLYQEGRGAPANPPGYSTHELRSDGAAYPNVPRGNALPWWGQGFDVNDSEVAQVIANARRFGWVLFRPYSSGVEFHHLNFKVKPRAPAFGSKLWRRFVHIRMTYPTS